METVFITSPVGLIQIDIQNHKIIRVEMASKVQKPTPLAQCSKLAAECDRQMQLYFSGDLKKFDLPVSLGGTAFQNDVWKQLQKVPFGKTVTYGELAQRVGRPKAARAVGMAMNRNPLLLLVPCHRVLGANGDLTGFACGLWRKELLLRHESSLAK